MNWGWIEAVHPDDLNRLQQYWLSILATCEPGEIEARLRRFDGEFRWFLFRARPHLDSSGNVVNWYGTNTDIEDRKQAEEALRESERQLHQLVDNVPGMIAVANSNGEHEYASKRTLNYTGTTIEESRGLGFIKTIHPDDQDFVMNEWLRCSKLGQPMDLNHRWRRFDGAYRWFHVRVDPLLDDQGRIVRWYGLLTDIDERRRAEDALRESEINFRLIVDTIPALICTMTARGEVELVNQQVLNYFGRTLEELKNWAFIGAVHDDDLDRVIAHWRLSVESGDPYEIEHRIRQADGDSGGSMSAVIR